MDFHIAKEPQKLCIRRKLIINVSGKAVDISGFADRYQKGFLKMVYESNQDARYKHFGDIDAGGFWIHHNLCEVTGVDFELFGMSVNELENREYSRCSHPLFP